jgi:hypothetical protein
LIALLLLWRVLSGGAFQLHPVFASLAAVFCANFSRLLKPCSLVNFYFQPLTRSNQGASRQIQQRRFSKQRYDPIRIAEH